MEIFRVKLCTLSWVQAWGKWNVSLWLEVDKTEIETELTGPDQRYRAWQFSVVQQICSSNVWSLKTVSSITITRCVPSCHSPPWPPRTWSNYTRAGISDKSCTILLPTQTTPQITLLIQFPRCTHPAQTIAVNGSTDWLTGRQCGGWGWARDRTQSHIRTDHGDGSATTNCLLALINQYWFAMRLHLTRTSYFYTFYNLFLLS